ncbi:Hypothetical protein FKW44_003627 [Caligus rogercresseyi]|uniref:Uncharacterized protein n=1 Tax=Caligus rogercresseyi TaxID=217165 RepID=A0A7T8KM03_CALRO|nr:Hypothetical protein FKW44_003627 [Caligus rogercresseyi]
MKRTIELPFAHFWTRGRPYRDLQPTGRVQADRLYRFKESETIGRKVRRGRKAELGKKSSKGREAFSPQFMRLPGISGCRPCFIHKTMKKARVL